MTPSSPIRAAAAAVLFAASTVAFADDPPPQDPPPAPALTDVGFGADLVPLVGTSAAHRGGDRRGLSVGVVTWSGAIDGFEATMAGSLVQHDVDGFQLSGGVQVVRGSLDGLQAAGGANLSGAVDGLQASGGANVALGDVDGLQASGGLNYARGTADGAQLTGGLNVAGAVDGLQAAPVNISLGHVEGLQLGVINVARTSEASVGLINLVWEGRTHLDAWVDESSFGTVAIKHGSDRFHNLWGASLRPFGDCPEWALLYGLGFHSDLRRRVFVEVDAIWRHVSPMQGLLIAQNDLYTGRVQGGLQLTRGLALTAGASFNTWVSTVHDGSHYSTLDGPDLASDPGLVVRQWPGFSVGVQLLPGARRAPEPVGAPDA